MKGELFLNKTDTRLQDILWALKKYFAWICLATMLFTVVTWLYTKYAITPMYRATISFCIFSADRQGTVTSNDLVGDARLAGTYKILLKSQPVTEAVSEALGGSISSKELSGMITTSSVVDTQVIYVYVTSPDPQEACDVANAIADTAPAAVRAVARAGELSVVNRPEVPTVPYSPNMISNVSGGFILGLLISCAFIVVLATLDTTIWHEEDLERNYNIPILGTVPSMTNAPSSSYRSYEYRR